MVKDRADSMYSRCVQVGVEKKMTEMKIYPVAVVTRYNYYSERPDRDNSLSVRPTEVRATSFDDAVRQLVPIWMVM